MVKFSIFYLRWSFKAVSSSWFITRLQVLLVNSSVSYQRMLHLWINIIRTFLSVWIQTNIDCFRCESVHFPMDKSPANRCRKSAKQPHIRPPFSPFFLRKCLTNSGRYNVIMLSQQLKIPVTPKVSDEFETGDLDFNLQVRSWKLECLCNFLWMW